MKKIICVKSVERKKNDIFNFKAHTTRKKVTEGSEIIEILMKH
jgi:hypothetical protein